MFAEVIYTQLKEQYKMKEEKYTKPGFDARIHYYEVLKKYMLNLSIAPLAGDTIDWFQLANGFFGLVQPYIKPSDATDTKNELDKIKKQINQMQVIRVNNNRSIIDNIIRNDLQDCVNNLYKRAKHMLLPIKEEDNDEWSDEEFTRGSE